MTMRVSGSDSETGCPSSGSMLDEHLATFSPQGRRKIGLAFISFVTLTKVRVQLWAAASWIRGFRRNDDGGGVSCADLIRASAAWKKMAGSSPDDDVVGDE